MGRSELMTNISQKIGISKEVCENVIDAFIDEIKDALGKGDKVMIKGFMSFEINERAPRKGRNPKTGEVVTFPATKTVKCKLGKYIKEAVSEK